MTANSQVATVFAGQREVSHIGLEGLNDFNDSVNLSVASFPSASNVTLFPSSVTVRPGQISTATLSFNSSIAQDYILTITGRSDGSSHVTNVTVMVQDFNISVSPPISPVFADSNRTLTLFVSGINGFSGTVTLTASISPHGPTIEVTPRIVVLTPGETWDASLTIDLPPTISSGSYTITINATGNGIHHRTILPLEITHPNYHTQSQFTILGLQLLQFVALVIFMVAAGTILAYKKLILDR